MAEEITYTVLVYKDEYGLWLKIPEADLQCCTEDFDCGLELLEEALDIRLDRARKRGEEVPERLVRRMRRVGKLEYGPTEVDLERARYEQRERGMIERA